ncbi:glutathione S-transferase D1-like isoform X1 [Bemisia tabaci]|uniref:glutathione S-transferase D1-like isoform X1 n=1 Tax=Bemisia tabaci TaxID=7038 RepID=UPI003B281DED
MLSLTKQFLRSQIQVPPSAAFSTEVKRHITLYQHPISPPCRAVIMAAKLIGVDLELKLVQIKDCKTQEFLKINPLKRIPVLDDGGFLLSESRAIVTYLSDKYGKDDSLYPRDLQARAIIDQMFYFDMGTLYQAMVDYWNYCVLKDTPHDEQGYRRVPIRSSELVRRNATRKSTKTLVKIGDKSCVSKYHRNSYSRLKKATENNIAGCRMQRKSYGRAIRSDKKLCSQAIVPIAGLYILSPGCCFFAIDYKRL